ncbi:S26 family signal peptidase [Sphingomonas sp. AP4-R1]|uniref:S26 family signal peptidase n=1 Tax=Sphingomonas sp. AP4-R1 TaxID=2735134 RepID=UPI0014933AB4|nr:S26 family signal peptidase [Sphingomonas sp. AP4-R1]QJU60291.1 S26 family signal peptidase [Sphingomonas sp. AP4-R1]
MSMHRRRTSDAPLLAWGEALAAAKIRRTRIARYAAIIAMGVCATLLPAAHSPAPRLVWNASASAPIGLYRVTPDVPVEPGQMVIARLPERYRQFAAGRHYLPLNVPLVKRVAAVAGDEICARGQTIFVNGRRTAMRRALDGRGRPMPMWHACIVLRGRELFLLMDHPASFDGRYFGPTEGPDIVGKATQLWRR